MSQKKDKILFFRESTFKVAELIFNYPHKTFHIRMLEKETGLSTTAVIKAAEELEYFKIIKVEKTPITTNIRADLESEAYRFYKMTFNIYRLKSYGFVDKLIKTFYPEAIVLFGSFAKGEDIENSDIDILIISHRKNNKELENLSIISEKRLNREMNAIVLPSLEKSAAEFKNAAANGIVLHGYLDMAL